MSMVRQPPPEEGRRCRQCNDLAWEYHHHPTMGYQCHLCSIRKPPDALPSTWWDRRQLVQSWVLLRIFSVESTLPTRPCCLDFNLHSDLEGGTCEYQ